MKRKAGPPLLGGRPMKQGMGWDPTNETEERVREVSSVGNMNRAYEKRLNERAFGLNVSCALLGTKQIQLPDNMFFGGQKYYSGTKQFLFLTYILN